MLCTHTRSRPRGARLPARGVLTSLMAGARVAALLACCALGAAGGLEFLYPRNGSYIFAEPVPVTVAADADTVALLGVADAFEVCMQVDGQVRTGNCASLNLD